MLLKQILKDIRQAWTWVVFYTVVTTVTVMAIVLLSANFSEVRKESSAISTFSEKNVYMFLMRGIQIEPNRTQSTGNQESGMAYGSLSNYLDHCFSDSGKAGSYVFHGFGQMENEKYDTVLILFGQYCNLTGLPCKDTITCYVPEQYKGDVGQTIRVSGREIQISGSYGSDFELYHPLYYMNAEDNGFTNTLILCTNDLETVEMMFPWWGLRDAVFDRMILVNPTMDEVKELQDLYYWNHAALLTGISTEDFERTTSIASIRAHRLCLWFYILSGVILLMLLLCNVIRMIEAHISDYTVHHLYGATIQMIRLRVAGFVFSLHILPLAGTWYVLSANDMALWYLLPFGIVLTLCTCLFAANYAGKRIGALDSIQNLRREY